MAIDTREKRQAVVGISYLSGPSTTSNASPDQEWRQEAGYGYPGILAGSPAADTGLTDSHRGFIANVGRMMR